MPEPLRMAHLASFRCGDIQHDPEQLAAVIDAIGEAGCDLVLVAGDLTNAGYAWEYDAAVQALERLDAPVVVVPGSEDSRNVGYVHFERIFGKRFHEYRLALGGDRRQAVDAEGVTVLALDSSEPDLSTGRIGREWYDWIRDRFEQRPDDVRIVLLHHHVVAIPGAGREANVVEDAGDLLAILADIGVDMVVTGHRHVPFFWGLNGMLLANCGTAGSRRVRGTVPPSWNEIEVEASRIRVHVRYTDGERQLAAIRSRASRLEVREHFLVTDEFFASNHLPVD